MSNDSASRNASASNAQMNTSVQPQYEIINMTTFNNSNLQKAAAIALDAQHTLSNFMDQATITYVQTQLVAHASNISITDSVQRFLKFNY